MGLKYKIHSVKVTDLMDYIATQGKLTWESPHWVITLTNSDGESTRQEYDNLNDVANVAHALFNLAHHGTTNPVVENAGPGTLIQIIEYTQFTSPSVKVRYGN